MKKKVSLWTDCLPDTVDMRRTADFLCGFGFYTHIKGELFSPQSGKDARSQASFLASIRIKDFEVPVDLPANPSADDIDREFSLICENNGDLSGAYDGFWFQRKLHSILPSVPDTANLVCTGRLICTYGKRRYHARVVVMGDAPTVQIVSSQGVVEGPARPPEYYWAKGGMFQKGLISGTEDQSLSVLDEVFDGKFIKQSDPLMGRVFSAYCLQPLMYFFTGREFCEDPRCSLFNSHRQSEVLNAQAKGKVCGKCRENF